MLRNASNFRRLTRLTFHSMHDAGINARRQMHWVEAKSDAGQQLHLEVIYLSAKQEASNALLLITRKLIPRSDVLL